MDGVAIVVFGLFVGGTMTGEVVLLAAVAVVGAVIATEDVGTVETAVGIIVEDVVSVPVVIGVSGVLVGIALAIGVFGTVPTVGVVVVALVGVDGGGGGDVFSVMELIEVMTVPVATGDVIGDTFGTAIAVAIAAGDVLGVITAEGPSDGRTRGSRGVESSGRGDGDSLLAVSVSDSDPDSESVPLLISFSSLGL